MDEADRALRNDTYQLFVHLGRAPTIREVTERTDLTPVEVQAGWHRLHAAHALVLDPTGGVRMANPFSAVPTAYRVRAAGRWWYGNCAWDAFGIFAALDSDGVMEASCADCGEALTVEIRDRRPLDDTLFFHCLVPAASWWDEITFT